MNDLQKAITNKYLYVPLIVWFCIQTFKVITDLIKTKKFMCVVSRTYTCASTHMCAHLHAHVTLTPQSYSTNV